MSFSQTECLAKGHEGRQKDILRVNSRRLCCPPCVLQALSRVSLCHVFASQKVEAAECASFPPSVASSMSAERPFAAFVGGNCSKLMRQVCHGCVCERGESNACKSCNSKCLTA
ncbi:unnamed protein product [Effrenium voratum]|uniref:Uncharacterized protein n=1 Tax=Effrenium voratum TaxID=2562239 RepID=A0AA36N232_9DINO|nr:unnamed protein product [Effrenium voratum]